MLRVAGADPGTSSLDLLVLEDGVVGSQRRFGPEELRADPALPLHWLEEQGPFALIAGPSGYGLPLRRAVECTDFEQTLLTLIRPDEQGRGQGVLGFSALVRLLRTSSLPVIFLPGVLHLPTVPNHRKRNRIDLGTPDKLCVAALALAQLIAGESTDYEQCTFCLVELGSAFTACLVVQHGQIVDGIGGTGGPLGWRSGGAWDGEVAYLMSPLAKQDLFTGGVLSQPDAAEARQLFRESLLKAVAGLQAVTPFQHVVLAGRLLETEADLTACAAADLTRLAKVTQLEPLAGAWVKHAAQGAAVVADGLAGGRYAALVERLALRRATGTVLDWLTYPRSAEVLDAMQELKSRTCRSTPGRRGSSPIPARTRSLPCCKSCGAEPPSTARTAGRTASPSSRMLWC